MQKVVGSLSLLSQKKARFHWNYSKHSTDLILCKNSIIFTGNIKVLHRGYYMYMAKWRYNISSVEKYFTRSLCSLVKYFSTLEEKFSISKQPCNFLFII